MAKNFERAGYALSAKLFGVKAIVPGIRLLVGTLKPTLFRLIGFPQVLPTSLVLITTFKCNSRCRICNIWQKYLKNPAKVSQEMSFDEFRTFVDNNMHLHNIALSGGEIYLRDDIVDMWKYLDNKGIDTSVTTNAVDVELIKRKESKILAVLSCESSRGLQISIDGLRKTHDLIRGVPGNFEKAVELLKWAIKKQVEYPFFDVSITHNITPTNCHELSKFVHYFIDIGLEPSQISLKVAQVSDLYYDNKDTYNYMDSANEIISAIENIQREIPYYNNYYYTRAIPTFMRNPDKFVIPCYAGFTSCYIDPYWNVYPCTFFGTKMGNLRDFNFELGRLWRTEAAKLTRIKVRKGKCPNCWVSCFTHSSIRSNFFSLLKLGFRNVWQKKPEGTLL